MIKHETNRQTEGQRAHSVLGQTEEKITMLFTRCDLSVDFIHKLGTSMAVKAVRLTQEH